MEAENKIILAFKKDNSEMNLLVALLIISGLSFGLSGSTNQSSHRRAAQFRPTQFFVVGTAPFPVSFAREPPLTPRSNEWNKNLRQQFERGGNHVNQCPCVKTPGSDKCITYDPQFQATTFAEAMINFPDLANPKWAESQPTAKGVLADAGTTESSFGFKCQTEECRACTAIIMEGFRKHRNLRPDLEQDIRDTFGTPVADLGARPPKSRCNRLSFGRNISREIVNAIEPPKELKDCFNRTFAYLRHFGKRHPPWKGLPKGPKGFRGPKGRFRPHPKGPVRRHGSSEEGRTHLRPPFRRGRPPPHRRRRQRQISTQDKTNTVLGQRNIINCRNKGEPETDDSDVVNLCSLCWAWRELPEQYFPTFINELVCKEEPDAKSGVCLSGLGGCNERSQALNVLRNDGTVDSPNWQPTTIYSSACCDCQVKDGSIIQELIIGDAFVDKRKKKKKK